MRKSFEDLMTNSNATKKEDTESTNKMSGEQKDGGKSNKIDKGMQEFSRIREKQFLLFQEMEKKKAAGLEPAEKCKRQMEDLNKEWEEMRKKTEFPEIMDNMIDTALYERKKEVRETVLGVFGEIMKEEMPGVGYNTIEKLDLIKVEDGKIIINLKELRGYLSSSFGVSKVDAIKNEIVAKLAEKMVRIIDTKSDSKGERKWPLAMGPVMTFPYNLISSKIEMKF